MCYVNTVLRPKTYVNPIAPTGPRVVLERDRHATGSLFHPLASPRRDV